jgi:hypothetical protein
MPHDYVQRSLLKLGIDSCLHLRPQTYAWKISSHWDKKLRREKISLEHFMAKTFLLHQISCHVNQRTQLFRQLEMGHELWPDEEELSKSA